MPGASDSASSGSTNTASRRTTSSSMGDASSNASAGTVAFDNSGRTLPRSSPASPVATYSPVYTAHSNELSWARPASLRILRCSVAVYAYATLGWRPASSRGSTSHAPVAPSAAT